MIVYQDKRNIYWFGSWESGLYRYDPSAAFNGAAKPILHFTTKDGLPNNRINEIKEDNDGNMYFNTPGGISKYDGKTFTTLPVSRTNKWKLQPEDLWFKNELAPGQVCRYDGSTVHILTFPPLPIAEKYIADHPRSLYPNMRSSPYDVYTVYKDRHGNIWFGTGAAGVCRYNGNTHDWITSDDVNEMHDGPANGVRSIIEDKEGKFWFCNTLYRYTFHGDDIPATVRSNEFSFSREPGIGSLDGVDRNFVEYLSATPDTNGHIWMATYRAGVYQYTGKEIKHHAVQVDGKDIMVFSIYLDHFGVLWLGTHENGALRYNGSTFEKFQL
jgi:ligand-binding sensor domain-containing protein